MKKLFSKLAQIFELSYAVGALRMGESVGERDYQALNDYYQNR